MLERSFKNSAVGIEIVMNWKNSKIRIPAKDKDESVMFRSDGSFLSNSGNDDIVDGFICEYRGLTYMVFKSSKEYWCLVVKKGSRTRPTAYFDYFYNVNQAQDQALNYVRDLRLAVGC